MKRMVTIISRKVHEINSGRFTYAVAMATEAKWTPTTIQEANKGDQLCLDNYVNTITM